MEVRLHPEISEINSALGCETPTDRLLFRVLSDYGVAEDDLTDDLFSEVLWRPRGVEVKTESGYPPSVVLDIIAWYPDLFPPDKPTARDFLLRTQALYDKLSFRQGGHAHDVAAKSARFKARVVNISAMSLACDSLLGVSSKSTLDFICHAQRRDGWFPYISPPALSSILLKFSRQHSFIQRAVFRDFSASFVDLCHHAMILNFVTVAVKHSSNDSFSRRGAAIVEAGMRCILELDSFYSIEPRLTAPRYCNFSDINALFILRKVSDYWSSKICDAERLLAAIEARINMLKPEELQTGILESDSEKYILPAQWMDIKYALIHRLPSSS